MVGPYIVFIISGFYLYLAKSSFTPLAALGALVLIPVLLNILIINMSATKQGMRGIQKRMEYYAKKAGLKVSCHQLRHTMATQLLNADADLVIIQDLLGHNQIRTTQRYCKVSNLKVQRDYHRAIGRVMELHDLNKTA